MSRGFFTHKKRRGDSSSRSAVDDECDAGIELTDMKRRNDDLTEAIDVLHSPFNATSVPNMKQADDRQQLARSLYTRANRQSRDSREGPPRAFGTGQTSSALTS